MSERQPFPFIVPAGFSDAPRSDLMRRAHAHHLKAGEFLIRAGKVANGLYVLTRGLLKVLLPSPVHEEDAVIISIVSPGAIVGDLALIDNRPRSASVVAFIDSEVLFVSRQSFEEHAQAHPEIYKELAELLAKRLRETDEALTAATFLSVKGRVARVLLEVAKVCGEQAQQGILLPAPIRQKDIAAMAGLTRETVNRVVVSWEHSGLLKRSGHQYCIVDVGVLEREAAELEC